MTLSPSASRRITLGATLLVGPAAAFAFSLGAGAGTAHAHGYSTPSGDAVGRPGLDNPAPGVRLTQAVGDQIFNQNTPFNKKLDDSPLGQNYHAAFGTPNYETPTHGSNGAWTGVLNVAGPLRDNYNAAQTAGTPLPNEENLPGTLVRAVSNAPAPTPHQTESNPHPAASCAVLARKTVLRAQGSC